MHTEQWLPIVDELGAVHGKIAYSLSQELKNKYLHPVVRIALIYKGMLFLKERPFSESKNSQVFDYPFERHVRYGEEMDMAVKCTFQEKNTDKEFPYDYVLRYVYRNEESNRLVYLCVCNIRDEALLKKIDLSIGKWWTARQIQDNLGATIFSDYFEQEFEFINSTILMAEKIMNDSK
jgi:hypothetical protein